MDIIRNLLLLEASLQLINEQLKEMSGFGFALKSGGGLPCGSVVKKLICQVQETWFNPWSREIPCAMDQ